MLEFPDSVNRPIWGGTIAEVGLASTDGKLRQVPRSYRWTAAGHCCGPL